MIGGIGPNETRVEAHPEMNTATIANRAQLSFHAQGNRSMVCTLPSRGRLRTYDFAKVNHEERVRGFLVGEATFMT